jgi:preprotein translocase, SecE subunit, bacterial
VATNLPDEAPDNSVAKDKPEREVRSGVFARVMVFFRQVIDELRKVVTPTRSELVNYTLVVLVFVLIMMALITGFDLVFGWAISWVFGDGSSLL